MQCPPTHLQLPCKSAGFARLIVQGRGNGERLRAALRDNAGLLGFVYESSMRDYLADRKVQDLNMPSHLPAYHLISVPLEAAFPVMAGLLRQFGNPDREDYIELIEPDYLLDLHAPPTRLGTGFSLVAGSSKHGDYLKDLDVPSARTAGIDGSGTRIAILDTGLEAGKAVSRYIDLTAVGVSTQSDNDGHGTAMTEIIRDTASGASLIAIRVTASSHVFVWDLLAGVISAVYAEQADIVSMSIGCKNLSSRCGICGGFQGARSSVCEKFFELIHLSGRAGGRDPVFVASTGNDGQAHTFDWPARFEHVLAVGSLTHARDVSSFSNNATPKPAHVRCLCPGGEDAATGLSLEYVGEGNDGGAITYCMGTSPATAYAAAILALLRQRFAGAGLPTDSVSLLHQAEKGAMKDVTGYSSANHGMGRLVYIP